MERIDSIKDARIGAARALTTRSGRLAAGRCLIEGAGLIRQVVAAGFPVDFVLCASENPEMSAELAAAGVVVFAVREGLLRQVVGGAKPVDWLAVVPLPGEASAAVSWGEFAVVCEQVADPGNLGTIVRTARALGVSDVVLTDDVTDLSSRRVLDASRGAVLGCRVRRFSDPVIAVNAMRAAGFQIVVTSPHGSHLQSMAPLHGGRVALVVGNETDGVSSAVLEMADLVVQIPMAGAIESLNVGVATGISIYELRTKAIMSMLTDRIQRTLGRNLGAVAHLGRAAFNVELSRVSEFSAAQAVALMVLACERTTTREQLCRDLGVGSEEFAALVEPLSDRGYIAEDAAAVTITTEGERVIAALWAVQERVEEALYAGFSVAERDQLHDMLRRVQDNAVAVIGSVEQ